MAANNKLSVKDVAALRAVVEEIGITEASKRLGINKQSLLALIAQQPVRAGTIAMARLYIDGNRTERKA